MIIYKIQNKINKKCHIGQTIHPTFNHRYSGGRWWDITDNPLLINAYNKYGVENFEIEILAQKVENIDKLNELEEFYADMFNSYKPNGYNLRKCGDNRRLLPHQIEMIRKNKSKTYFLRKIDTWEIIEIFNLQEFCRKENLSDGALRAMIAEQGGIIVSNGYCLPTRTKQEVQERKMTKFKNKTFKLLDKKGELVEVNGIMKFAEDNDLEMGSFYKLLNGDMLHYKGFRLPHRENEWPDRFVKFELISPNGEIFKGQNLQKFCIENNLSYAEIGKVLRKERLEYYGWKRSDTTEEDILMKGRTDKNSITLINPQGQEIYVENLYLFCKKNNLNYELFYNLYMNFSKTATGWTKIGNEKDVITILISPEGQEVKIIGRGIKNFCNKMGFNYQSFTNMLSGSVRSYKGWKTADDRYKRYKTNDS